MSMENDRIELAYQRDSLEEEYNALQVRLRELDERIAKEKEKYAELGSRWRMPDNQFSTDTYILSRVNTLSQWTLTSLRSGMAWSYPQVFKETSSWLSRDQFTSLLGTVTPHRWVEVKKGEAEWTA